VISAPDQPFEGMDRLRLTIFQQYWWLKIARGSARLKEVQVHDPNGVVIGSLPYIVQRNRLGIPWGGGPRLSRVSGPIVGKNLSDEEKAIVFGRVIRKLPNISFTFSISEHIPDARLIREAFKNAGFECFEQINYSQPPEDAVDGLGKKLRQHIKQAYNKLDIINTSPDDFINFYRANLEATSQKSYFPLEIAREMIEICVNREPPQALIFAASKKVPEHSSDPPVLDAAICIVWDKERCYYWLSTRRKESHPDAIKLLIAAAMKHARKLGLIFDADGVTTPGTERLYKTIFRMPNEEKRYIFTRTSRWSQLYETHRYKIDKVRRAAIASGLLVDKIKRKSP
jgi:hypothetical protein